MSGGREHIDPASVPQRTLYTGAKMPAIGLGTFGSDKYSARQIAEAVYGGVRAGYRLIDCAAVYGNEKEIGAAFQKLIGEGTVRREELFITSKVWNDRHRAVAASCEESLRDLGLAYVDLYFVHWPFPNYHAPGCGPDARNPDSRPFSTEEFLDTWRQCEELVERGLARQIGMSNMTVKKLEAVLPHCRIRPAAIEMELHPSFQQKALFRYVTARGIVPIGFCPLGSPSRPERDRAVDDVCDMELSEVLEAAQAHGVHPALVCLKWAVQNGHVPIPFAIKPDQYWNNLKCVTEDLLSAAEMAAIARADKNCRLVKGQVFLWQGAENWKELWDGE